MTTLDDAHATFYDGARGPQMPFVVNDCVRVLRGTAEGLIGYVISVQEIEPNFVYLVERRDGGGDVLVAGHDLLLLDSDRDKSPE